LKSPKTLTPVVSAFAVAGRLAFTRGFGFAASTEDATGEVGVASVGSASERIALVAASLSV
jgi:hypothetical protein